MAEVNPPRRVIIGISGATGAVYGIRALETLQKMEAIQTHLVISPAAERTILAETEFSVTQVAALADVLYDYQDIGAALASGSFYREAMIILPCSIRTMAALATGLTDNLLTRAGDVTLKEGRPLVVAVREAPLHVGHLRQMIQLAEMGGIIFPPVPAYYNHPRTIDDLIDQTVGRILDRAGLRGHDLGQEWQGAAR
jgi:4-hydroxy-3-polyprenylbenzoate decarboxylase